MTEAGPLDDTELQVLRVIMALVQQAGPSPHVRIPEIVKEARLAEPVVHAALKHLSPRYIDLVEHLSAGGASGEPVVMGVTADAYEVVGG